MLQIIQKRKIYYIFSGALFVIGLLSILIWGFKPSIDFTGGSLLEVQFSNSVPTVDQVNEAIKNVTLDGGAVVQPTGQNTVILRFKNTDEAKHQEILSALKNGFEKDGQTLTEKRFESIGPSIGQELFTKAIYSIIIVSIGIIIYVAWAFKKVSFPVESWKYGSIAVLALIHDITITSGIFAILGHFAGVEVGMPFVAAILTILGYSVNDTIVVFDRVRENLFKNKKGTFEEVVNDSVNQTMRRSINTVVTVLLALVAVYLFGGESIKTFALALIIGVVFGCYSSIFLASPLLVTVEQWSKNRGKK